MKKVCGLDVHKDNQYNLRLLYYALQKLNLENLSKDGDVSRLNRADAYSEIISLHDFLDQQKIVSEIEKIETQIAEAQKIIDEIPAAKNAVLKKYL
ncbi:MAG: hypothetical protein FWD66_10750 [Paludibacter sp.]|nr:hypothetical protein [Paludibacter sp.]